jgi:SAM-dependent methyltransferase
VLTAKLAALGCDVVGVDASEAQIAAARALGLDARVADAERLEFHTEFDAVFSNAALHWMRRPDDVIAGVWRALKPGSRFVAEMGGSGCVAKIKAALVSELGLRGIDGEALNPWFFPTPDDYSARLSAAGFTIRTMALIPRPTPLPGDVTGWLETFAEAFLSALPSSEQPAFVAAVRERLQPQLCNPEGVWIADYIRLRFSAEKPAPAHFKK